MSSAEQAAFMERQSKMELDLRRQDLAEKEYAESVKSNDTNLRERLKERKQSAYSNAMQQLIKQYDGKLDEYTVNSKLEKPDITLLPPIAPTHEDILALAIKIEDYVNS